MWRVECGMWNMECGEDLEINMRPTALQFRSPKEKTAEYVLPVVTNQGSILLEVAGVYNKKPSFAKSRRFPNYDERAKITGYRVGPGSYHLDHYSIEKSHVKGTHLYKDFHRTRDIGNNGYIFIGNHLMFDATFLLPSRKHPTQYVTARVDVSDLKQATGSTFQRLSTSSNSPIKMLSKLRVMSPIASEFTSRMSHMHSNSRD